jgi:hypothetical protein
MLRKLITIFAVCLMLSPCTAIDTATAQTKPAPKANQKTPPQAENPKPEADEEDTADTPNDELEEAAVKLDVSRSSPLIQKLYQATRDTWSGWPVLTVDDKLEAIVKAAPIRV